MLDQEQVIELTDSTNLATESENQDSEGKFRNLNKYVESIENMHNRLNY